MKAVCWRGSKSVSVDTVPDPHILNPRDAIIRVTSTAICGSDLHLYNGRVPTMKSGDILGHEFMGEVVEVGPSVKNLKVGDRVVVPFPIACGKCAECRRGAVTACPNSNPNAKMFEAMNGYPAAGIYGYSHITGGYAGGQAEYVRVPFADFGPIKIEDDSLTDDQVLFLSDILPTAYESVERVGVGAGDTVAIWGCGPVGLLAVQCAYLVGAERVISIDRHEARLAKAQSFGADVIDYEDTDDMVELLKQETGGKGPDKCIDAVGMEAHGTSIVGKMDRAKQALKLELDNGTSVRQSIQAAATGGKVSIIGVYMGFLDKFPLGQVFNKGLGVVSGQCNVHKYLPGLLERISEGALKPDAIITHRVSIDDAPRMYDTFEKKEDDCVKVVMRPAAA